MLDGIILRDTLVYLLGGLASLTYMRPIRSRGAFMAIMIGNGLVFTALSGLLNLVGVR